MFASTLRHAEHHLTRRHRAGALLVVVLMALVAAGCMPAEERTFLDRTNALRSSEGVRPLRENDVLTRKAEDWARHMVSTGRLEHTYLSADLPGIQWTALAENVARSSPTGDTLLTLHNLLAGSSGHRSNMVDRRFTHMGVGMARGADGRVWVVEVFAAL